MAAVAGREFTIAVGATTVAGCRTKSLSINKTPIDVTNDDDSGFRTLLAEAGQLDIDLSMDGIAKSDALRLLAIDPDAAFSSMTVTFGDGDTLTGSAFISSYEESGTYNDAVTFSASMLFSGTVAGTAVS
jgi:predicted secreted protein